MKRVNNTIRALAMVLLVCMLLTNVVFAAENGSAWLAVTESEADQTTTAVIAADVAVTDGLVEITYDSSVLTYAGLTVNETCVAMHAVNADQPGTVKISWVAPGAVDAAWILKVLFTGADKNVTLTGSIHDASGAEVTLTDAPEAEKVDTTGLEAALETAKGLYKANYTTYSFRAVEKAMKTAEAVLADPDATQAEVDAAEQALVKAMNNLMFKLLKDTSALTKAIKKAKALDENKYTAESYAVVQEALTEAQAVLADKKSTQQDVDEAAAALNAAMDALVESDNGATEPSEPDEPQKPGYPGSDLIDLIGKIIKGFFGWFHRG